MGLKEDILNRSLSPFTLTDLTKELDYSRYSIRYMIDSLVKSGYIVRYGKTINPKYYIHKVGENKDNYNKIKRDIFNYVSSNKEATIIDYRKRLKGAIKKYVKFNSMRKLIYDKTLYSRAKNSQLLQWTIEIYQTNHNPRYAEMVIYSGYVNGTLRQNKYPYTKGKNIGKSNETDGLRQALNEAKSRVEKQLNKGYKDVTLEEAEEVLDAVKRDKQGHEKPMLAKKYRIGVDDDFPKIIQRKYNGVRAELGFKNVDKGLFGVSPEVYLLSREGKYYVVPDKMKKELENIAWNFPEIIDIKFDGEIYNHDLMLQEINSAIKKRNSNSDTLHFKCYDIKNSEIQSTRLKHLEHLHFRCFKYADTFKIAESITIHNEDTALRLADEFIKEGYEGAILRNPDGKYVTTRSSNLLKIKKTYTREFKLVRIHDSGRDMYKGLPIAKFECVTYNNKPFMVTPKYSKQERYQLYINADKYIGENVVIEYREVSKDSIPMHATGKIEKFDDLIK